MAAHDGPTEMENLASVCAFDHHLVHDKGYRLQRDDTSPTGWRMHRPDGTPIPAPKHPGHPLGRRA